MTDISDSTTQMADTAGYTVLARRYRPKQFDECIGQEHVARSLKNAIENNRVAHAYLFTGSRGVGKTSTARILAKALNCQHGPTPTPCDECDICKSIASGEDVDVIEIDGASNRGIDEVRDLRQGVNYRPSRSRYKIYIIDEVHMLTTPAFNALLKTLEEPPEHAKFIFATTEPQKIPITILSRCQRFDFAGIDQPRIVQRLREIVEAEGMRAEDEALEIVARRAGGSMRDSQSLLDQLLAFGSDCLTAEDVHRIMGTAAEERVADLAHSVLKKDAGKALQLVDEAVTHGVQLGEWVEQLLQYFRDLMVLRVNPQAVLLSMPNRMRETMQQQAKTVTAEQLLEMMDLLSACRSRMKTSTYGRTLLEMTLVRLCRLDQFLNLATALTNPPAAAQAVPSRPSSIPPAGPLKKNSPVADRPPVSNGTGVSMSSAINTAATAPSPAISAPQAAAAPVAPTSPASPVVAAAVEKPTIELSGENVQYFFQTLCDHLEDIMLVAMLKTADKVELRPPATMVVHFPGHLPNSKSYCEDPSRLGKVESLCRELAGRQINVKFELGSSDAAASPVPKRESYGKLLELAAKNPIVKQAEELLDAKIIGVDQFIPKPVSAEPVAELEKDNE